MACALNKEQIIDLYEVIYGEIHDRIVDDKLPVFNIKTLIKEVYEGVDESKALIYAQAVPDILTLVSMDDRVKKYLKELRDKKLFSLDDLADLGDEFSKSLDNVLKYVTPEEKSFEEVQEIIMDHNTNQYNFDIIDGTEENLIWTEKQFEGQKAVSAYMTVPQQAVAINPEFITDENRNFEDPEKALIYSVIQNITYITRQRLLNTDDVVYNGEKLKLRVVQSQSVKEKLTPTDKAWLDANPLYRGVIALISDEEGNILYFDNEGKITTEDTGIMVYQNIRDITKVDGKLSLTSKSGRHQTLASPKDIVATIRTQQEDAGLVFDEKYYFDLIAQKKQQQEDEINNLYKLRQKVLNNPEEVITLPIVSGSFGITDTKYVPLSQTDLTEDDLQDITINTVKGSKKSGFATVTISRDRAGVSMDIPVTLQRGDMPESLADKIATVLTTQAKLNGQPLDANRRKAYTDHFLSNAIDSNKINIQVKEDQEGIEYLEVKLIPNYDDLQSDDTPSSYRKIDLSKPEAYTIIKNHLLKAKHITNKITNKNTFYAANISYSNEGLKNGSFTDYIITGDKITEKEENYFDFVKPYIKIEYSKDSMSLKSGFNSYLRFDIPEDVLSNLPVTEFTEGETTEDDLETVINEGGVKFNPTNKDYKELNGSNIDSTDATINIGRDFTKGTAAATKKQAGQKNVPVTLPKVIIKPSQAMVDKTATQLNKLKATEVHITGDNLADLKSQEKINGYVLDLLEKLNEALDKPITKVVTGGQSGVAEAATIAAKKLGLTVEVNAPKQWMFRTKDNKDSKTKKAFLSRFGVTTAETTKAKTKAEDLSDEEEFKIITNNDIGGLLRGKTFARLFGKFFEKKDIANVEKWWSESPLKDHISLERITTIVNSNAFASWSGFGITLYEADGGTSVDLYHEAWHAFSQLFLTLEEKQELYDTMKKQDKWKNSSYLDIEEVLAEDFRSYAKGQGKFTGPIGRIFKKMLDFLRKMFGKITRRDMLRPRDIASVKEYYDKLYKGEFIDLQPSLKNIWTSFDVLNRSKTINTFDQSVFTIDEASLVSKSIDSIIASIIKTYNTSKNVTNGAERIFHNPQNRTELYKIAKVKIQQRVDAYTSQLEKTTLDNATAEEPDYFKEEALLGKVILLNKVIDNFGDIQKSLDGETKKGVVAFNIENTRFNVLKDTFTELEDDASEIGQTRVVKESTNGNIMSSKSLASEQTMMLLAGIFKMTKSSTGELVPVENALGFDELENVDKIWNKLARVLQGQLDPVDMYNVISKYRENYVEFAQLLDVLSNPFSFNPGNVGTVSEFDTETNFWQDFKKPRIPYVKLNINKTIIQKKQFDRATNTLIPEIATYESRLANASFDVYKVINEWTNNLINSDLESNEFIKTNDLLVNSIDIPKILKRFGNEEGVFKAKYAQEFLKAIGIEMDQESMEIEKIMATPRFSSNYGIDRIFNILQIVNKFAVSGTEEEKLAAQNFAEKPIQYLLNGLDDVLIKDKKSISGNEEVRARLRALAEIQNMFSNSFSNFSVLTPEGNRVFEHFMDSTLTRRMAAMNKVDNFTELTSDTVDINKRYRHMRWLNDNNNPHAKYSVLLNSLFILDPLSPDYGKKRPNAEIDIKNVSGTELLTTGSNKSNGVTTSSSDRTTKYLQEMNTMLLRGVQEFMRHASKQMSQSVSIDKIKTYDGKKADYLYVDISAFKPNSLNKGANEGFNIMLKYLAGEHERINRFNANINNKSLTGAKNMSNWAGYNRKVKTKNGEEKLAGSVFTAFDDVLTQSTKDELYAIKSDLIKYLDTDDALLEKIRKDVNTYFEKQTQANYNRLQKTRYIDSSLVEIVDSPELSRQQVDEVLVKAYTYNSWIHNYETVILTYGDLAQFNHDKEEFHKRNAGLTSPGRGFRTDLRAQSFINGPLFKNLYSEKRGFKQRVYNGTLNTAIIEEKVVDKSVYYDEYREALHEDWTERLKNNDTLSEKEKVDYANKMADTEIKEYTGMKEGDGQGHIAFDTYRMLKKLEGNWSDDQEELYRKIVNEEEVNARDIVEFFPPYKLQYFGNIESTGLTVTSFHKFSLAPLIPSVIKGAKLNALHELMLKNETDYVIFGTGSKIAHISSNESGGDIITDKNGSIDLNAKLTNNVAFVEYLKNQTEINKVYKEKTIFSTQLRKLILEGLYEKGIIASTDETQITNNKVLNYINHVSELSSLLKLELLDEIGFEQTTDTNGNSKYTPVDKESTEKLARFIRANLEKEDVLGDHLIEFITTTEDGELKFDLSLHPEASKIEKLILSVINKRLIKQKVHGEALVQVSAAMYEGVFDGGKLKNATDADIKKYVGSNFLPTYHKNADGFTAGMKVMVSLQGDFINLLNLKDKAGNTIGTIDKLNDLIKDDEWLEMADNRDAVTMVGVRIPVQGLNSMEFMEVYHFLPAEAGNIIVAPTEIVAKSGGDFDIDKMTIFMPNVSESGEYTKRTYASHTELEAAVNEAKANGEPLAKIFKLQKAALENELIQDIKNILALPENYASLIRPNGTYLLKGIADSLAQYVMDYDPKANMMSDQPNQSIKQDKETGKYASVISPTRVLESLYNIYKHESNVVGKKTLGLGAIENTFHTLFNSLGASMPSTYIHGKEKIPRDVRLFLKHNTLINNEKDSIDYGKEVVSLSNRYDADNINKIADLFAQAINGWVDVEKDAWIFFIQGNSEVAPILLYLLKAGVPVKEAIYFVSQPLVKEYVEEQRVAKSTFAEPLGKAADSVNYIPSNASRNVIAKHFNQKIKSDARYSVTTKLADEYFDDKAIPEFTENEMLNLIKDSRTDPEAANSELSKLMFLHYLEIEQQMNGVKKLKLNANADTSLKTSFSQIEDTESSLENLKDETKLDQTLLWKMINDSVTSSFFNGPMALQIGRPLFKMRYHPLITKWMVINNQDIRNSLEKTFGVNKKDLYVDTFRNDMISLILQNTLRKYNIDKFYKSYNVEETIPVEFANLPKFGAFVKKNKSGIPTMYIDKVTLEKEFENKSWSKSATDELSYNSKGLYALPISTFMNNGNSNKEEYFRFVAEREYLRSISPFSEISKTNEFVGELKKIKESKKDLPYEKQVRLAYEKILADKALSNTFNPSHLFKNTESAFAIRLSNILTKNPKLRLDYDVLDVMKSDSDKDNKMFNIYVNQKDYTNSLSNIYHKNLLDLANPKIKKSANEKENQYISDFFAQLPLYAFLQSGINKTKFNFVNIVDYTPFINVIEQEKNKLMSLLDNEEKGLAFLDEYYKVFNKQNSISNFEKSRFKDYFMDFNQEKKVTKSEYTLEPTISDFIFKYDDGDLTNVHYKNLVESNPTTVFINSTTDLELRDPSKQFKGQSFINKAAKGMNIALITALNNPVDNLATIPASKYFVVKDKWEEAIQNMKELIEAGNKIAFSTKGYGDINVMPQELFVYLSRRLYEEFGYINPNSTMFTDMLDLVAEKQGISDAEIDNLFTEEEDPFKC
jgi:hypothetical protein